MYKTNYSFSGDEYSAESSRCSSITHSRDQSPCTRSTNNRTEYSSTSLKVNLKFSMNYNFIYRH